jgi:HlyD family secretion protein
VASLKATIAQAEQRIAQIESGYRQQLHNERVDAEAAYARLNQDWDKQQHRHALLELKAPQAGAVKDLATHTPGTVVAPGTILLTLVPRDEPLIAEVWVNNADAGSVLEGQRARVKIAAYPFQKHGMLDGKVLRIAADAQERTAGDASQLATRAVLPADAQYRALIALDPPQGKSAAPLRLVPGMVASAEIHVGRRTVLDYLFSPIQKVAHEAGRER